MNLRDMVLLLAATTLAACSTTSSRVALFETGNQKLYISGSAKNGAITDELVITVNGQAIIQGTISTVQPTANLTGTYQGIKIDAECKNVDTGGFQFVHQCIIYANSAKAAELSF